MPIKYHNLHLGEKNDNENNNPNTDNHPTLSPHSSVNGGIEIKIEPSIFKNNIPGSSLTSTKNNWLINSTSTTVPHDVQCVIQLGENFSLPMDNKEKLL